MGKRLLQLALGILLVAGLDAQGATLLAHWSFDESLVHDDSGNGFDGQIVGTVATTGGVLGQAALFIGEGHISVDGDLLGMTPDHVRSISFWLRPDAIVEPINGLVFTTGVLSKYRHFVVPSSNYYVSLQQFNDGRIETRLTGQGTDVLDVVAGTLGEWQHYAFILQAGTRASKIYRNGQLVGAGTLTYYPSVTDEPLRIGTVVGTPEDQNLQGAIDDLRIYDGALSEVEIEALAQQCSFGPGSSLTATRSAGPPTASSYLWSSCGGDGEMLIVAEGGTSVEIHLNGILVLPPGLFAGDQTSLSLPVALVTGENVLSLKIRGQPGARITIDFEQSVRATAPRSKASPLGFGAQVLPGPARQ